MMNSEEIKKCSKCGLDKPKSEFYKCRNCKQGIVSACKKCHYDKYHLDIEETKMKRAIYREKTKDHYNETRNEWFKKNPEKRKQHRNNYKPRNIERRKERRETDPIYNLTNSVRCRLYDYLKRFDTVKTERSFEIVGCSIESLKEHLEKQFKPGMTWENYGFYGWHIDHIIPLSSAETEAELYKLFHYSNLQPLLAQENMRKSDKIL